jgi:hypothetical protein
MATIVTRAGKGSPLTNTEVDANFTNLNTDKLESSSYTASDVLTKIKTVDGTGSGLDADLLDGNQATAFATAAQGSLADSAVQNLGDLGITSTAAELNKLDGFTGTKDDLNYAKDLRATGVTSTEYDYLDGVTSNIQTQIDNKLADSKPILDAISATIADTAVDIFIYDTRKDSDGGAWRKRTQHTSWYNETLNTSTRGSRREFPAVAVIVAEADAVTIYDGDDPDLPMWFKSRTTTTSNGYGVLRLLGTYNPACISALNGKLFVGINSTSGSYPNNEGVHYLDFLKDEAGYYTSGSTYGGRVSPLTAYPYTEITNDGTLGQIVDPNINDVAMTVLPNAPIDPATGLPVPTIAVATNGGVSVIKDDGSVVDITDSGGVNDTCTHVWFDGEDIWFRTHEHISFGGNKIPSADVSNNGIYAFMRHRYFENTLGGIPSAPTAGGTTSCVNISRNIEAVGATSNGVDLIAEDASSNVHDTSTNAMVCSIRNNFNTGWMNGDIKLATLSDTDDPDVTGTELVTNGTFDTDTTGWSAGNATLSVVSGKLRITATSGGARSEATQDVTTVAGKKYVVSTTDVVDATTSTARLEVFNAGIYLAGAIGTGSLSATFVAGSTSTTIDLAMGADCTTGDYIEFDNVSVRLAEEDRSVNGNGLQVFGTVTKNPVATGADLVAYSGFSNSTNYLKQPYNSDLEIGSGDISFSVWIYPTAYTGYPYVFARGNNLFFYLYVDGNIRVKMGSTLYSSTVVPTNTWSCVTVVKRSGVITIYLNGNESESGASTDDITAVDTPLYVGVAYDGLNNFLGKISLLRISATAPSAEQIKKIYEDEKVLFQENAQATLYGSSDAVTALAYDDDTELLHVGTSAGRSVFQGLRRVDNTTDAVGAAISASGGMVADD